MKRNIKTQQGSLCLFFVSKVLPVIKDSFKTVITIFIIIFTLSFGTSCKQRMNIKEFIERELAKDRSNTIVLYDTSATGYNNTVYVPSENDITGTVNIKNEYNVGYTAHLTLDAPSQSAYFAAGKAPKITLSENDKFQFTFTFKKEADGNASSKGAEVPVTVKLIKKEGGALFAEKRFTIRCNTPPAPPSLDVEKDVYTITKPADTDFATVETTFYYGSDYKKASDWSCSDGTANRRGKEYMHAASIPINKANGDRKLVAYALDTAGLKSEPFEKKSSYLYSSDTTFGIQVVETTLDPNAANYTAVSFINMPETLRYPYRMSNSSYNIKISELAEGASVAYANTLYDKVNDIIKITLADADNNNNTKTLQFKVTSEDESQTKTYTFMLARQDGFKLSVDNSGASSPCDIKLNNTTLTATGASVHASDLNDGKLKVQIASKSGANLVNSIQAKIDQSDASDPAATANFYGTNTSGTTKEIYGYSFELPMVQSQTLTIGYDNTIRFDGNGEATIPGEPPITIQVDNSSGKITMLPCDPQASYPADGIIDFSRHPVLDMISNFAAAENFSPNAKQMFPSKIFNYNTNEAIIKVILPKNIAQIKGFTFYSAANLKEIIFPDGFEGDISDNLAFFNCTALEKVQINKSNRYFNDAYGNLIEKEQQGSSYTYENCTVRLAVKNNPKLNGLQARLADGTTIQLQQTSGSDPFFAVYLANGSHNGSAYKITEIKNQACMAMFKYGVIDLPDLKKIWVNNFSGNKITALFITARTPANIDNNNFAIPKDMKNTGHVYVQNSSELEIYKDKWAKDNQNDKSRLYTANNFTISGY